MRSARTSRRKASVVAIAVAGVPGCLLRYSQRVAAHFRFGLLGSLALLPDLENCPDSFLAWLIIACTRSSSGSSGLGGLFCALVVRVKRNMRPRRLPKS